MCGARVEIEEITGYYQADDGSWVADEIIINCVTEPRLGTKKWDEWMRWHWENMPYVYWPPLSERVKKYVEKNYRFDIEDTDPTP